MIELGPREAAIIAINGYGAMQKPQELEALLTIVNSLAPKIILEIGVGKGGTSWCWSKFSSVSKLLLVDLPGGPWGGGPDAKTIEFLAQNSRASLHFIAGNSLNSECFEAVKTALDGELIDFLMIDGDHSKIGVAADYELYSPLVRKGGLIAFHDICEHSKESGCEVKLFWDALKKDLPEERYAEFIAEPTNWGGIATLKT